MKMVDISSPFSKEEIKVVVWGLGGRQHFGPNGFPIFFYRHFWEVVNPKSLVFWSTFTRGPFSSIVSFTHTWFPFRRRGRLNRRETSDLLVFWMLPLRFYPRCWLTALGISLETSLMITQFGFLKGRSILNFIATAQDNISGFMLKLDFEKAYDTVEWGCILETLLGVCAVFDFLGSPLATIC